MKHLLILFTILSLGNCNPDSSTDRNQLGAIALGLLSQGQIRVNQAQDLPQTSNDDYNQNTNGLITAATLSRFVQNWNTEKTRLGISGKLNILQINSSVNTAPDPGYIQSNPSIGVNVYAYNPSDSNLGLRQVRNDGILSLPTIPEGAKIDAFLKAYGIDLQNDLTVFVSGRGISSQYNNIGRGWYVLRRWGASGTNLAVLNGALYTDSSQSLTTVGQVFQSAGQITTSPQPQPNNGTFSVKQLKVDNTILSLAVEDVIQAVRDPRQVPGLGSSVFIVDARSQPEFGGAFAGTTPLSGDFTNSKGATAPFYPGYGTGSTKSQPFEGSIRGAKSVPWQNLLQSVTTNDAGGFQYISKAQLANAFAQAGYTTGQTTLHYCRTNQRSMTTTIATVLVLGYPTATYENSFVEWLSLTGPTGSVTQANNSGSFLIGTGSRFATDSSDLTQNLRVNNIGDARVNTTTGAISGTVTGIVAPSDIPDFNATATTSKLVNSADKLYKLQ